jgi:membrane associated rhomboid family serine protease
LIVINVLAYFLWQQGGVDGVPDAHTVDYGAIPYELTHPGEGCDIRGQLLACGENASDQPATVLTVFTSMFMHGSLLHLGGNMLFLWIFGNNIEDAMGRVKFVLFYVLGGIAALGLQTLLDVNAAVPTVGASGAISAVLGGYLLLYPRARIVTLLVFPPFIFLLPAMVVLVVWIGEQLVFGYLDFMQPTGGGGVAYGAHVGGFVFGFALVKLFAVRRNPLAARGGRPAF